MARKKGKKVQTAKINKLSSERRKSSLDELKSKLSNDDSFNKSSEIKEDNLNKEGTNFVSQTEITNETTSDPLTENKIEYEESPSKSIEETTNTPIESSETSPSPGKKEPIKKKSKKNSKKKQNTKSSKSSNSNKTKKSSKEESTQDYNTKDTQQNNDNQKRQTENRNFTNYLKKEKSQQKVYIDPLIKFYDKYREITSKPFEIRYKNQKIYDSTKQEHIIHFKKEYVSFKGKNYPYKGLIIVNKN